MDDMTIVELTEEQKAQIRERWHAAREDYCRVIERALERGGGFNGWKPDAHRNDLKVMSFIQPTRPLSPAEKQQWLTSLDVFSKTIRSVIEDAPTTEAQP